MIGFFPAHSLPGAGPTGYEHLFASCNSYTASELERNHHDDFLLFLFRFLACHVLRPNAY